ncbi:MAG TPA: phenylalanine--tRNA ligase subunit beta [Candidatus Eisenbacteria bacterium]|nr:phenylalanine--tRNA ligase subunit beta [Candidatus Eisenbacteria bacterium]
MKVAYDWLKEFVNVTASPEEVASRLALTGTNIASIEKGPHGAVIDAEITSNRPDCLGMLGIAREVAAAYRLSLKTSSPQPAESSTAKAADAISVKIEVPELCGRFTARVIRGVKIQPSPQWLKNRLEAAGTASINNVVDVSNYVMLELGHPLHTFDYDLVRDRSIVVRRAKSGEKIKTLDTIERVLDPNICVVADGDGSRSVGIGGIMGGADTEISFSTKNVFIECAWFDPVSVRRAARSLRLHTEASTRFGRGADPNMAEVASRRAAELILQLAGGELLSGVVDIYPGKRAPKKITLTRCELLRIMGADVPDKDIEAVLSSLGFAPVRSDQNAGTVNSLLAAWECTQPSWRAEVEREIDLIEEVARVYGLGHFPARLPAARAGAARLPHYEAETRLRERLIGLGYHEILTIPHVAEDRNDLFRPAHAAPTKLNNPLSEEAGVLKSTGAVTMAGAIEWNLNHGQRNARLFEIGSHYRFVDGKPAESRTLSIGATGAARPQTLYDPPRDYSFADLKGDLDAIGALSGGLRWEHSGPEWLNPARRGAISLGKESGPALGFAGQLGKRVAEKFKFRQDVFLAEIDLGPLYCMYYGTKNNRRYQPLPRFPGVERDFSLFLADGVAFAQVWQTIEALAIPEVVSVEAADLFRGKNVPAGKYSLLVRVAFQSREVTLNEAQINEFSARIVSALEKNLGAMLRAQ